MRREHVPLFVSRIIEGRPVRWAPPKRNLGDFDGRERTLQVFNADAKDQRRLLDEIDRHRAPFEEAAGGPLVVVFHSVRQSAERHAEFVDLFVRWAPKEKKASSDVAPPLQGCVDEANESGPHRRVETAA